VTREAFTAAANLPDFPRAIVRYGRKGGRELFFCRSQVKAWQETQRALVSTFR